MSSDQNSKPPIYNLSSASPLCSRPNTIVDLAIQKPSSRQPVVFLTSGKVPESLPESTRFQDVQGPGDLEGRLTEFVTKLRAYKESWNRGGGCQCPERPVRGDQDSMQRLPASRPASRSPEGAPITLPPVRLGNESHSQEDRLLGRVQSSIDNQNSQQAPHPNVHPSHPREDWRPAPSRDLGVLSMLNPTEPESTSSFGRRPLAVTASPLSAIEPRPSFGTNSSIIPRHSFPGNPPGDEHTTNFTRRRPILAPRSPSRAFSSGRSFGHATIDAQQSPFLSSRRTNSTYIAETGQFASSNVPPLMTPPAGTEQLRYGFPPTAAMPSLEPRRFSAGDTEVSTRVGQSESTSPSISASSHNPTSPAQFPHNQSSPPFQSAPRYYPGSSFAASMQVGSAGVSMQSMVPSGSGVGVAVGVGGGIDGGPYNNPIPHTRGRSSHSSSADSSNKTSTSDPNQTLTFSGPEGSYQVPVDFHQASRSAGEKRARNAGSCYVLEDCSVLINFDRCEANIYFQEHQHDFVNVKRRKRHKRMWLSRDCSSRRET